MNHNGEALDKITKATFPGAEITEEHRQGVEKLPPRYKYYFETNLYFLLETYLACRKTGTNSSKQHTKQQILINTPYFLLPNH